MIRIWSRRSTILPQFVGLNFGVYNGQKHIPVLVKDDPAPGAVLVQLARVDATPIFEGTTVPILATVTPADGVREVRFSVEGTEQETVVLPPFQAALRMRHRVGPFPALEERCVPERPLL